VVPWANASIDSVPPLCENSPEIFFTAADTGGMWWGPGISDVINGGFNPGMQGPGLVTIYYGIDGMCGDTASLSIMVNEVPIPALQTLQESCTGNNDASIVLTVTQGLEPYSYIWNNGADSTILTMLEPGHYSVTVSDSNNCSNYTSADLFPSDIPCYTPHVYVPNVFSPNGDGINDVLYVRGAGIEQVELLIYDRWGERVFESRKLSEGWDGRYRNRDCEQGVYFFDLKIVYENNEQLKLKGNLSLLR